MPPGNRNNGTNSSGGNGRRVRINAANANINNILRQGGSMQSPGVRINAANANIRTSNNNIGARQPNFNRNVNRQVSPIGHNVTYQHIPMPTAPAPQSAGPSVLAGAGSFIYHHAAPAASSLIGKTTSLIVSAIGALPRLAWLTIGKYINRMLRLNAKRSANYLKSGECLLKYPLLVSDSVSQGIVNKFCTLLQLEKAENIRTFFFNNKINLAYSEEKLAKEFDTRFYKEEEETNSVENYGIKPVYASNMYTDYTKIPNPLLELDAINISNKSYNTSLYENQIGGRSVLQHDMIDQKGLKLSRKELMPISPTMICVDVRDAMFDEEKRQILGIRYIPHRVPFKEMEVAFKFGILNSRFILRFIKFMRGDISLGDFLLNKDKKLLNYHLTKISINDKSWNKGIKDSTDAVTVLMSKEEFDFLKENVVDLSDPKIFKHAQKDIGSLDLIVIDLDAQEFIRINASDNFIPIKYDMRDALNAHNKDIVLQTKIESSKFSDEDIW